MTWGRWWAHKNVPMTISFDPAFYSGQFPIIDEFRPAPQVKRDLRLLLRQFDGQRRHVHNLRVMGQRSQLARAPGEKAARRLTSGCANSSGKGSNHIQAPRSGRNSELQII